MAELTYQNKIGVLWCIERGYLDILKILDKKGIITKIDEYIVASAKYGMIDIMKYLVQEFNINAISDAAMVEAIKGNHLACVKYLTDCGTPLVSASNPLLIAINNKNFEMINYILSQTDNFSPILESALKLAVKDCSVKIVRLIINKAGKSSTTLTDENYILMHDAIAIALENNNMEVVHYLAEVVLGIEGTNIITGD